MAGYSGTPLPKKLGIKDGHSVALIRAPRGFLSLLGDLPPAVSIQSGLRGKAPLDVVIVFVTRRAELARQFAPIRGRMAPAAGFWVAWPKQASGVPTDLTENVIRDMVLPTGLVDNKVCAIDETWSALRLVIRVQYRR